MPAPVDIDAFGPLLHGTARAWRLKLDERLKPLGMSQARWRTLLHLSRAQGPITQAELAARLGVEEPTLVNLLHRLEETGWVKRLDSAEDRRCKTVRLQPRARRVIASINATAGELRCELLTGISPGEIQACVRVLEKIRQRAEHCSGQNGRAKVSSVKR
jgi:MarR family transcriptional regulator for hemolysin